MRKSIIGSLFVVALTGGAAAQQGEIFIPSAPRVVIDQPAAPPANRLAGCLADPSAESCTGVNLDPDGIALESFADGPQLTFETLVLDLGNGNVTTSAAPPPQKPDYAAPVPTKVALPAVAITVEFDFNSAYIRPDQAGKIATLSEALRDPSLQGTQFAVIGHTDASGSDAYNCDLSRRRADQVTVELGRQYITTTLYPIGFGEHVLKNTYDPRAAENRRVTFLRLPDDSEAVLSTSRYICGR